MTCPITPSEASCCKLDHPDDRLNRGEPVVTSRQLSPVWHMKRRSALDRHAAFVRRLERQRLARKKAGQESAEARVRSQGRLHTFTRQLRHAILHNADVASGWRPAARMLDVKATLDKKLIDQSFASAATRASHFAGAKPTLSFKLLDEMSHLVDGALRDTPASCLAASDAALVSAWDTLDSASSADKEPSADQHMAGTGMASQQSQQAQQGIAASCQPQEHDEQAQKGAGSLKSGASVRSVSNKKPSKPAWALTADAAKDAEQQEEEDLLAFAGGLEFDDYINQQEDAELRTVLQEMRTAPEASNNANKATLRRHVVRAINNMASKDVKALDDNTGLGTQSCCQQSEGAASTFSRATVANRAQNASGTAALLPDTTGEANTKWDSSTKAGSDVGSMLIGRQDWKAGCGDLLRENPEMKRVHSLASAAAILKRIAGSSPT